MKFIAVILIAIIALSLCNFPVSLRSGLVAGPTPTPLTVQQLEGNFDNDRYKPITVEEAPAVDPSTWIGNNEADVSGPPRPSNEVLENNKVPGTDGLPNRFFYTREQARQLELKRYASGPCKGYYQGEEWWCK